MNNDISLQWRHNGCDSVSNYQPHHCLLNGKFSADQRKHQSSASLAFVRGIHRWPVNSPHKWPVTRKMFPFYDVIMWSRKGHDPLLQFVRFRTPIWIWSKWLHTLNYTTWLSMYQQKFSKYNFTKKLHCISFYWSTSDLQAKSIKAPYYWHFRENRPVTAGFHAQSAIMREVSGS